MKKNAGNFIERRKFSRLNANLNISVFMPASEKILQAVTKNISADGIHFENNEKDLNESDKIDISMSIPLIEKEIVHITGRIIWKKKISLEDTAPYDYGVEIVSIKDSDKNSFLKFLCDKIYAIKEEDHYV